MKTNTKNSVGRPKGSFKYRNPFNPVEKVDIFTYRELKAQFEHKQAEKTDITLNIKLDRKDLKKFYEKKLSEQVETYLKTAIRR